jgi:hypothetical protein
MIFFEHDGSLSERQNRSREIILISLMTIVAIVLLPFTILLGLFWLAWGLATKVG